MHRLPLIDDIIKIPGTGDEWTVTDVTVFPTNYQCDITAHSPNQVTKTFRVDFNITTPINSKLTLKSLKLIG